VETKEKRQSERDSFHGTSIPGRREVYMERASASAWRG